MRVISHDQAIQIAHGREDERQRFLERLRATLGELLEEALILQPFEHGTFFEQMGYELNTMRVEAGDQIASARRGRARIRYRKRKRILRRDGYSCQECGWHPGTLVRIDWEDGRSEERWFNFAGGEAWYRFDAANGKEISRWTRLKGVNAWTREADWSRTLTIDHIIPTSEGGTDEDDNLVTKCGNCNAKKGRTLPDARVFKDEEES